MPGDKSRLTITTATLGDLGAYIVLVHDWQTAAASCIGAGP